MRNKLAVLLLGFAGMALGQGITPGGGGGGGGTGTVTSITTTGPIAGGPITTTGAISCPTCATSTASLASLGAVVGAGSQGIQTSSQFTVSNLGTPGTEAWTLTNTGLGTTPAGGHALTNSTTAAAGAQQVSPPLVWTGQGWKTTATAASQSVAFQAFVLPVQSAASPTGQWVLQSSINGAAFGNMLTISTGMSGANPGLSLGTFPNTGLSTAANDLYLITGNTTIVDVGSNSQVLVRSVGAFAFNSGNLGSGAGDTLLTRFAAATLQFGAADGAAPVAQSLRFQSVVAGTLNTAGVDSTFKASAGTGTGIGGSHIFQVAPAGSSGTAQNALVTALTIDSTKLATFSGTIKSAAYQSSDGSAGVTGATCTAWKNGLCTSL